MKTKTLAETVRQRIKTLRKDRHLTQDQLCEKAGISTDAINKIENGSRSPNLFQHLPEKSLSQANIDSKPVLEKIACNHYEKMCLDKFQQTNVRGIIDLADRLTTRLKAGKDLTSSVNQTFSERFPQQHTSSEIRHSPPVPTHRGSTLARDENPNAESTYEPHRDLITKLYKDCKGNISATVRALDNKGVSVNRGWLTMRIKEWGLPQKESF